MRAVAFDTLEFFETLKEAGVPDKQAKAFSMVIQKSHEDADLATKQDITQLRYEMSDLRKDTGSQHKLLRHEISDLRKDMKIGHESLRHEINGLRKDMDVKHESLQKRIEESELRLTIKLGAIVVAAAGILPLFSKFLHLF